jgi:hypothetical protein
MNVETKAEAALFPEKECIYGIFVAVCIEQKQFWYQERSRPPASLETRMRPQQASGSSLLYPRNISHTFYLLNTVHILRQVLIKLYCMFRYGWFAGRFNVES